MGFIEKAENFLQELEADQLKVDRSSSKPHIEIDK